MQRPSNQSIVAWVIAGSTMAAWTLYDRKKDFAITFSKEEQQNWNQIVKQKTKQNDE